MNRWPHVIFRNCLIRCRIHSWMNDCKLPSPWDSKATTSPTWKPWFYFYGFESVNLPFAFSTRLICVGKVSHFHGMHFHATHHILAAIITYFRLSHDNTACTDYLMLYSAMSTTLQYYFKSILVTPCQQSSEGIDRPFWICHCLPRGHCVKLTIQSVQFKDLKISLSLCLLTNW